jgi:hypothetical protein
MLSLLDSIEPVEPKTLPHQFRFELRARGLRRIHSG